MSTPVTPSVAPASSYSPISDRVRAVPPVDDWSLLQRLGFRLAFSYVLLYTFPGPLASLPLGNALGIPIAAFWRAMVPWIGRHVLHLARPISLVQSGSGDKLFDWVQVFGMLCTATIAALVWTALERRHRAHPRLFAAFQIYLRYTLAAILFGYGFDKLVPNQFEPMGPTRLTQYFGEAAPGGFAWSFLGSSVAYTIFAGAGEAIAGCLLIVRRTATLGAIVGAAVMTNVFMLNMSYDIPVKQYSGHLLVMLAGLVACDAPRLIDLFFRNRAAEPRQHVELFATDGSRRAAQMVGVVFGLVLISFNLSGEVQGLYQYGRLAPRGPLYGIFDVEQVVKNGAVQAPLLTDATRWRRLASSNRGTTVRMASDSLVRFRLRVDAKTRIATLTPVPDSANKAVLAYAFPDSMHLLLRGRIGADSVEMTLRRRSESSYLLVNRGFHWINETPYFR